MFFWACVLCEKNNKIYLFYDISMTQNISNHIISPYFQEVKEYEKYLFNTNNFPGIDIYRI